ncbi:hypothetical protein Tco_0337301 [Tanacetum coccineum]
MDKCKTGLGYNAVSPPYTRNFMPPKSDLVYPSLDDFVDMNESISESVVEKLLQNSLKEAVSVNTARPINTAFPRPTGNCAIPASNVFNKAHSHVSMPFNKFTTNKNSNFNEKVNTVRGNVTTVGPKAVGNPQLELQEKGIIDIGCSRHMTGNMSYLSNYEEIDGGYVAFGGDTKGGKITSKGKIRTCKLDIEDVYFVMELKFNLFSVSEMCDKKNSVLFTDTEYSTNSKAIRVFNSRTRIVEDSLHVKFSEDTPNIVGSEPNWLFDIDALTKSMNYEPVVTGNQSSGSAGTKACDGAGKARMETVPGKDYILLPFLTQDPSFSSSSKDSPDS